MATSSNRTHRVVDCRVCACTEPAEWRVSVAGYLPKRWCNGFQICRWKKSDASMTHRFAKTSSTVCWRIAVVVLRFRIPNPGSRIPANVPQLKSHCGCQESFHDEDARRGMNRCWHPVD